MGFMDKFLKHKKETTDQSSDMPPPPNLDMDIPPPPDFSSNETEMPAESAIPATPSIPEQQAIPETPAIEQPVLPETSATQPQELTNVNPMPEVPDPIQPEQQFQQPEMPQQEVQNIPPPPVMEEPEITEQPIETFEDNDNFMPNQDENVPTKSEYADINPEKEIERRKAEIHNSDEPLFVKIEDYKEILGATDEAKTSLKECDEILKRLNDIKLEEDKEYEKWKNLLLDTYRKINYVDRVFFEKKER